ncbi:MAG TPA: hypothetical protein PK622_09810 [Saprospiraceae bacterium]|jgi:tetratricopeptide (TPR) repeat protein|nr:tetratricopeptide repeat protein [Saprospiraceae bacterium]HOJ89666.1 hypothetical protein [Saprospiraceae bacterium]HUN17098.1 hypothetical protein [Saprospiraceae bacterium]
MDKRIIILFLLCGIGFAACNQTPTKKPVKSVTKTDFQQGLELMTQYRTQTDSLQKARLASQAVPFLEKAYFKDTANSDVVYMLGNTYYAVKDYNKAIYMYLLHKTQKPEVKEIDKNLAMSYRELGRRYNFGENNPLWAKRSLVIADSIRPNDPETLELLGIAECGLSNFKAGMAYYDRVLKLNPQKASTYFNMSLVYAKKGDFEKCQEYLDRANKITPGFVNPYLERHKKGLPIYPQDRPRQQPH